MEQFPLQRPQAEGIVPSNLLTKELHDIIVGNLDISCIIFLFPETLLRRCSPSPKVFLSISRGWLKTVIVFTSWHKIAISLLRSLMKCSAVAAVIAARLTKSMKKLWVTPQEPVRPQVILIMLLSGVCCQRFKLITDLLKSWPWLLVGI